MNRLLTPKFEEAIKDYPLYSQDGKARNAVCVAYIRQLAVNYHNGYYDERNETAARRAAMMYDTLMNGDEIYDPEYKELKDKSV